MRSDPQPLTKPATSEISTARSSPGGSLQGSAMVRLVKLAPGLTFSWRRLLGITSAKRKIARATGIPTTRSGRRAKVGRKLGIK